MVGTIKSPRNGLKIKEKDTKILEKEKKIIKGLTRGGTCQVQVFFVNALGNK
jgi:hypothetical protein